MAQITEVLRKALFLLFVTLPLASVKAADDVPAAFVKVDPATQRAPYEAFRLIRSRVVVPSDSQLQPCDQLLLTDPNRRVVVSTFRGGKDLVLSRAHPELVISCDAPTMSPRLAKVWEALAQTARAEAQVPALTRGNASVPAPLALPVFDAERTLVVAGRRNLFMVWVGGQRPYRVELRAADGKVLTQASDIYETAVQLSFAELAPGRHVITVYEANGNGLMEDRIFAVVAGELPSRPAILARSDLTDDEQELLYAYYLDGFGGGEWTFEALQRAHAIQTRIPGAASWIRSYGGGER